MATQADCNLELMKNNYSSQKPVGGICTFLPCIVAVFVLKEKILTYPQIRATANNPLICTVCFIAAHHPFRLKIRCLVLGLSRRASQLKANGGIRRRSANLFTHMLYSRRSDVADTSPARMKTGVFILAFTAITGEKNRVTCDGESFDPC